jgi:hypothetical protein
VSWANELRPMEVTFSSLYEDLCQARSDCRERGIPNRVSLVFLLLRILQRTAYYLGWISGLRSGTIHENRGVNDPPRSERLLITGSDAGTVESFGFEVHSEETVLGADGP